jgi:hypothetical protein
VFYGSVERAPIGVVGDRCCLVQELVDRRALPEGALHGHAVCASGSPGGRGRGRCAGSGTRIVRYLRHVQAALVEFATSDRSFGEVQARVCKRLGESDPAGVRLTLYALVSGKIGRDGRNRLPRQRRARLAPGAFERGNVR